MKCLHCNKNIDIVYRKKLIYDTDTIIYTKDTDQLLVRWSNNQPEIPVPKIKNDQSGYYCPECDKLITTSHIKLKILFRGGTLSDLKKRDKLNG